MQRRSRLAALAVAAGWLFAPLRLSAWQGASQPGAGVRVRLSAGEFLLAAVAQGELDVSVSVKAGDGSIVEEFDGFDFGSEPVAFVAPAAGTYSFAVRRADGRALAAPPAVTIVARRTPLAEDADWIAAVRLATRAKRLQSEATAASLASALNANREALTLWERLSDQSAAARTSIKIGDILYAESAYAEAKAQYLDALRMATGLGDRRIAAECRNNAGMCALQLGEDDAMPLLRQAQDDWRALRLPFGEAAAAANLGLLCWRQGAFDDAVTFQQRALAVFGQLGQRRAAALSRNNLGLAYSSLNRPALALEQLRRARFEFHALGDKTAEGQALVNIGYLELLSHRRDSAVRSQQEAIALLRDGPDVRARADAMINLGRALTDSASGESLRLFGDALVLYEGIGDRRGQASALHRLGRAHAAAGEPLLGLEELDRAFRIRLDARIRDAAAESLFESACILETLGREEEAAERLGRVIGLVETLRSSAGGEAFRTSYFSSKHVYFERYTDLLMRSGRPEEALAAAERARGRTLLDLLASAGRRIAPAAGPALLARKDRIERRLNDRSQRLLSLTGATPDAARESALRAEIDELLAESDTVESEIRKSDPGGAELWNPRPADLAELQGLLDDQTEMLEFALGEERSYLWVVTRSRLRTFTLPARASLEATAQTVVRLARAYRSRQRDATLDRQFRTVLERMSSQLLGAAAGSLDSRRWVVVPDGMLHYLPFAAVRLAAPAAVAAKREGEIVTLPSASALAMLHRNEARRGPALGGLAIFADPVFDRLDPRVLSAGAPQPPATPQGQTLARLPFSRSEAEAVAALGRPKTTLLELGFDASKSRLTSPAIGQYRILHLSTHAALDDERPELSRIALSQVDPQGRAIDGFLRLYEIYNLRLPATRLVVLSACDSGAGRYVGGEGLVGFANGFLHAGAGAVLATLWTVEDRAGQEFMGYFYQALLVGRRPPPAALAAAQQSMRKDDRWRDPYYWAGFVLISAP